MAHAAHSGRRDNRPRRRRPTRAPETSMDWTALERERNSRHRNVAGFAGYPTTYLLSRPAVESGQLSQRGPGAVCMVRQHIAAGAGNIDKTQLTGQESADGGLIRGVEDGSTRAAPARNLITQFYGGEASHPVLPLTESLRSAASMSP